MTTTTIAGFTCGTCGTPIPWSGWHSCSTRNDKGDIPVSEFGNIEQFFRDHFGKGVKEVANDLSDLKARAITLENWAAQHAQIALAAAQREVALAQALAPSLGDKAQAIIEAAEKGLAVVEAYVQDVTGNGPTGM